MSEQLKFKFAGQAKSRLDAVLLPKVVELRPGLTRSQIQKWIYDGLVTVDREIVAKPGTPIRPGALIELVLPQVKSTDLEPFNFELKILFEDKQLIVIDKPPGLSMHPGAGNKSESLANALVGRFADLPGESFRPGIVHRLDKDTTGIVVVAKTVEAHAALSKQFAERSVSRAYQALVLALPKVRGELRLKDEGEIDKPIGRHSRKRTLFAVDGVAPKIAKTHWKMLDRFDYAALLELKLETGRTHQIRVHLDSIGSPVIGDKTYGNFSSLPKNLKVAGEKFGRQALHAYRLGFIHPKTKRKLSFESDLPADFIDLINIFKKRQK